MPGGRPLTALHATDLSVDRGEFLVITGRSGSGKTTLLNVVAGLTRPTAGNVELDGVDVWSLSDVEQSRLRNRTMGFVFQFPSLMPTLTVLRNATLPLAFAAKQNAPDGKARAVELLDMVGLGDRLEAYPRQLSAGQQQRVVIARALINRPELLLADEPSSDLDEETEGEIMSLFSSVHRETGVTILMVTHTKQLVAYGTRHVEVKAGALGAD
jgi:ABC-type lipoprotein export system ATPase subunit